MRCRRRREKRAAKAGNQSASEKPAALPPPPPPQPISEAILSLAASTNLTPGQGLASTIDWPEPPQVLVGNLNQGPGIHPEPNPVPQEITYAALQAFGHQLVIT